MSDTDTEEAIVQMSWRVWVWVWVGERRHSKSTENKQK